ncbi:MAG: fused MFS/spermidine synthase, partial [Elusimicrobiota bacterium]|nr:fused MFS/spermidine synthase [Elusimicrobiota bacterium]
MKKYLILGLILIGFTSLAAQIVLMRELMVVFYGNELSLGITLAGWLFWVAVGSWGIGRLLVERIRYRLAIFALGEILLALFLPASIFAARAIPLLLKTSPGEIIGLFPMIYSSLVILAPTCLLLGFLFVLGCRIYSPKEREGPEQIGYVYVLEAIGATSGGLLSSLLLIRLLPPLYIMLAIGLVNLVVAFSLTWFLEEKKSLLLISTSILILLGLSLFSLGKVRDLRQASLRLRWRAYQPLTSKNSIYGNITVIQKDNTYSFFNNGLYNFTVPDKFTSERIAHFALLEHPRPRKVLLIGGGVSGVLKEILKHPVEKVDYLELDPLMVNLAKKYLYSSEEYALNDRRVEVKNMDGRLFVRQASDKYDIIIVNLPQPFTAQINRFYTFEFFKTTEKILGEKGIIFFGITSSPNYIGEEQRNLLVSLNESLKKVFAEVRVIPGDTNYFLGCKNKGVLTLDYRKLMERLNERKIDAKYVREYYLASELSDERISYLEGKLMPLSKVMVNYDFRPISYYYDMVLWSTHFKLTVAKIFKKISPGVIYVTALIICFLILLPVWLGKSRDAVRPVAVLTAVATTGFAEITFQVVTLLSFQIIYGYVYYKLSIILTSFMIGLIFGGWWATRTIEKGRGNFLNFIQAQIFICIYPLILPIIFLGFAGSSGKINAYLGSNLILPFLPVIAGFIGGFQFPLANKLYLQSKGGLVRAAGLTYGLDLFGSCLGALLVSVFLLPILGIPLVCLMVAFLNVISLVLLL